MARGERLVVVAVREAAKQLVAVRVSWRHDRALPPYKALQHAAHSLAKHEGLASAQTKRREPIVAGQAAREVHARADDVGAVRRGRAHELREFVQPPAVLRDSS